MLLVQLSPGVPAKVSKPARAYVLDQLLKMQALHSHAKMVFDFAREALGDPGSA